MLCHKAWETLWNACLRSHTNKKALGTVNSKTGGLVIRCMMYRNRGRFPIHRYTDMIPLLTLLKEKGRNLILETKNLKRYEWWLLLMRCWSSQQKHSWTAPFLWALHQHSTNHIFNCDEILQDRSITLLAPSTRADLAGSRAARSTIPTFFASLPWLHNGIP